MMAAWNLVADSNSCIPDALPSWLGCVGLNGLTHSRAGLKLGAGQHAHLCCHTRSEQGQLHQKRQ